MIRKILKVLGYTVVVLAAVVVLIVMFAPPPGPQVLQTLSAGGKTVHLVSGGPGNISMSATMESDGSIVVNGQKIDLAGGDVFTIKIFESGRMELHKGAP